MFRTSQELNQIQPLHIKFVQAILRVFKLNNDQQGVTMKRKLTLGIAAAALAATTITPTAFADETTPDTTNIDPGFFLDQKAPTKKDPKEQAEITGMQLDNAKKGVETAKGIVDTLNGLGGLFGLNNGK